MSSMSSMGTMGLSVILLPFGAADRLDGDTEGFSALGFPGSWEVLRCPWSGSNDSSDTSLAEEKNWAWRGALGEWLLFFTEGSELPPLEPFQATSECDLICPGPALVWSGAPDLGATFAIRRTFLEALDGFSALPGGVEAFELGLRAHEAGARTLHPVGWTRSGPGNLGSLGALAFETVLALFYRHPYHWVLSWACDQLEARVPDGDEELTARFARLFGRPVPANCRQSAVELGHYFAERSDPPFQPPQVIARALEVAEAAGLYASGPVGARRFERSHAANWLMANTGYFEAMTARDMLFCLPPPRLTQGPSAPPLSIQVEGRYEVEVTAEVAAGLRKPMLALPLPVECDEQRDVQLFDFEPPEFGGFMDAAREVVNLPLSPSLGGALRLGYSFRCRVHEGTGGPAEPRPQVLRALVNERYGAKLDAIITTLFPCDPLAQDPQQRAYRIYQWMLDHIAYLESDRMGLFALEARAGNCAHRVRLFRLLCDRVGLPVRERCGVLLSGDMQDEGILNGQRWASTARTDRGRPLIHIWAEVFLGAAGWTPLDFLGADSGSRMMTPVNVRDAAMRARLKDWTPRLDRYYFGNVDPYRIYFGATPKSLSGIPSGIAGDDLDAIWHVAWGTRHTLRTRLLGLPPSSRERDG